MACGCLIDVGNALVTLTEVIGNPYKIEGAAHVSVSGGLTSHYMLRQILDAHGGALPPDVHALFCNTGKEREETLAFVSETSARWNVPIVWLEYVPPSEGEDASFRVVTYDTASRRGEPFDALIEHRSKINEAGHSTLPNPVAPWCSSELKQRTMRRYMTSLGYEEWTSVVGLRADERKRVARMQGRKAEGGWIEMPLARAGVGVGDVAAFWAVQPFTLRLRAYEGNCDLCYKKAKWKIQKMMVERPELSAWWESAEKRTGTVFRQDRPRYVQLRRNAQAQGFLDVGAVDVDDEDDIPCACTD